MTDDPLDRAEPARRIYPAAYGEPDPDGPSEALLDEIARRLPDLGELLREDQRARRHARETVDEVGAGLDLAFENAEHLAGMRATFATLDADSRARVVDDLARDLEPLDEGSRLRVLTFLRDVLGADHRSLRDAEREADQG